MNNVEYIAPPQITLTEEQQKVYDELIKFLKNDTEQQLLLSSAAGTGKTTVITHFINNIIKNKLCNKIAIATPTHKSLAICKSKLFETSTTSTISANIDIMTIHRLLNYQQYIDSNGEVYYAKGKAEPNFSIFNIILVDECSMLSSQIIDDIDYELQKDKNKKIKIIFTGDQFQLPAVNEKHNKIFTKKIKTLTLEKIIRTNSQSIMELSAGHRKWISTNKDDDMPYLSDYMNKNIVLHSQKSLEKWLDKFISHLKQQGVNKTEEIVKNNTENLNNNIILTWTNKKCNKYNDYIRQKMFNKKVLDKYEIGEILIFNDFHRILMNKNADEEEETDKIISFYTSEQIKLHNIKQDKFQFERIKNLKSVDLPEDISTKFIKTITSINKVLTNTTLNVYFMGILKISELKNKDAPIYEVLCIHQSSEVEYNKLKEYFEEHMVKLKNSCYKMVEELKTPKNMDNSTFNMVKTDYLGIVEKKINRIWKDWQSQVIDRFAQLNYGYSITVHKSQGSTFMNVFIDIQDIFSNPNQSEKLKCLYTAITRSSHSLELLV
jgi:superfamily I DNA/RNA helicase